MIDNAEGENLRFEYTYSANTQGNREEIAAIRKKYLPIVEDKLELLKKLDKSVERQGLIVALSQGITGAFLVGMSACCINNESIITFVLGMAIGVIGGILIVFAYPAFKKAAQIQKEKVTPQILSLSEELSKECF